MIYDELSPFIAHISEQNAQIMRQVEEITQQKNRIDAITKNMNEGLIILDKNALILSLNKNAAKIFGTKPSAVTRQTFFKYFARPKNK